MHNPTIVTDYQAKGRLLEYAIARIEEHLLEKDPSLRGTNGKVEKNKIVTVDGVRHEVDVWIVVNSGSHLETTHIIEAKNWKGAVGTDEVSKLKVKRDEVRAASATLVARRFSRDARNLASKERITLLEASEDLAPTNIELSIYSSRVESGCATITFSDATKIPSSVSFSESICTYRGQQFQLGALIDRLVEQEVAAQSRTDPRNNLGGMFTGRLKAPIVFTGGELLVADCEVSVITLELDYSVNITLPAATWRIGVEKKGGLVKFQYPDGTLGYKNLTVDLVTGPKVHPSRNTAAD